MNPNELKRAFVQTAACGLITLGLTYMFWGSWVDLISDIRSGETTVSSGSTEYHTKYTVTWREDPIPFAIGIFEGGFAVILASVLWLGATMLTLLLTWSLVDDVVTWIKTAGGSRKLCTACKRNCANEERYQDDNGDYFCKVCYETGCMFCGRDCSDIERVSDDQGHLLCPTCFEKTLQIDQAIEETQSNLDQLSATYKNRVNKATDLGRMFKLLDYRRDESSDRGSFGIRGWFQLAALALLLYGILRLFGYFDR